MQTAFQASEPQPLEQPRVRRSRHHPRSARLLVVSSLLLLSWLGLGLFLGYAVSLWRTGTSLHGWLALAGLFLFAFCRGLSFILSRHLNCTLCHGPVLHEKRCHKHPDAYRMAPLSYRSSTVVSMLSKGVFRCMYCGTPYRLKK